MDFREALTIVHVLAEKQRTEGETELPEETVSEAMNIIKNRLDALQESEDSRIREKLKARHDRG